MCRLRRGACLDGGRRRGGQTIGISSRSQADERYPGIAAHLHACGPCGEDFEGLLAAIRRGTR